MKKALLFGSLAVVTAAAQAVDMPTISGRLNNEVRYTQQSDGAGEPAANGYTSFNGITGVANAPSYLKAAGNLPINEMLNLDYALEIGVRIEKNETYPNGLDLRQNYVSLNSSFGSLILGQAYTPVSGIGSFDLLGSTGAGLGGSDFSAGIASFKLYDTDYAATVDGIGFRHTLRKDIVGYKSPKFMGLQLFAAQDSNNTDDQKATNPITRYDFALNYDNKFGDVGVKAMVDYLVVNGIAAHHEEQMTGAVKVNWMGLDVAAGYVATSWEVGGKDIEKTSMFAGVGYTYNAHKIAYTYGTREFDNKATSQKSEDTQMSLGYEYAFNKNIAATLTGSMLTLEDKSGSTKKNEATVLGTGLRVTF